MLLPRVDPPVPSGQISLGPYESMNPSSVHRQLMRAMRQTRGFAAYELTISGSDAKASFLAAYAGLSKDDAEDEGKLSLALDSLLLSLMEAIDEAVSAYPDEDHRILKAVAARSLKRSLADALKATVEEADAQLVELRKETP